MCSAVIPDCDRPSGAAATHTNFSARNGNFRQSFFFIKHLPHVKVKKGSSPRTAQTPRQHSARRSFCVARDAFAPQKWERDGAEYADISSHCTLGFRQGCITDFCISAWESASAMAAQSLRSSTCLRKVKEGGVRVKR